MQEQKDILLKKKKQSKFQLQFWVWFSKNPYSKTSDFIYWQTYLKETINSCMLHPTSLEDFINHLIWNR